MLFSNNVQQSIGFESTQVPTVIPGPVLVRAMNSIVVLEIGQAHKRF